MERSNYSIIGGQSSEPIAEVGGFLYIARKKPGRRCDGACKCGIGFSCGGGPIIYGPDGNPRPGSIDPERTKPVLISVNADNNLFTVKFQEEVDFDALQ